MQGGSPPGGSGGGTFGWGGGGNGGGENSDRDMMGWVGLGSGAVNGTFDAYPNRFMSKMSSSWNEVSKQGRAYLVMFGYIMKALKPHVLPIYIPIIGLQFVSKEAAMVILGYTARICCLLAGISLVLSVVTSRVSVMNDCSAGCQMGADESAAASLSQDEDIVLSALDGITPGSSTTTAAVDTAAGENSEAPFALVTGASSGIGREIALVLASRGYSIILVGRKQGTLKKVKGDIRRITQESGRENGGVRKIRALTVVADLGEENGPEKAWEEISNRVGKVPIDIVVQNAGCYWREPVIESRTEELRQVLMVNVVGTTLLTKFAAESMAQRGCGRVLIIGSITGFLPIPTQAVYAASKAYLKSFSLALGSELRPLGVGVTCASPGITLGTNFAIRGNCSDANYFQIPGALDCNEVASRSVNAMLMGDPEVVIGRLNKLLVHVIRPLLPPQLCMLFVKGCWAGSSRDSR